MEVHALLAEARRHAIDDEAAHVEVLHAQPVAQVVPLRAAQVFAATRYLQQRVHNVGNAGRGAKLMLGDAGGCDNMRTCGTARSFCRCTVPFHHTYVEWCHEYQVVRRLVVNAASSATGRQGPGRSPGKIEAGLACTLWLLIVHPA